MFLGTFVEEVISPIPSVLVLAPAGVAAAVQGRSMWFLLVLVLCSAVGRILGASLLYWLADKLEDLLLARGRTFFGVSHRQLESFGQRLGKSGWRDWMVLFLANALPFFPGALLSIASGFLKVRFTLFATATFFGTMVNALFYLYIGYAGLHTARLLHAFQLAAQLVGIAIVLAVVVGLLVWYRKRHRW